MAPQTIQRSAEGETAVKTLFEKFIEDPKRRQHYEREALALQASELIFELMEQEGMTKAELAERIGTSRAYVTQVLNGSRNMTIHTLADLAFATGCKIRLEPSRLREIRKASAG